MMVGDYFSKINKTVVKTHFKLQNSNIKNSYTLLQETIHTSTTKESDNKIALILVYTIFKCITPKILFV